jgi:hypothetical protein
MSPKDGLSGNVFGAQSFLIAFLFDFFDGILDQSVDFLGEVVDVILPGPEAGFLHHLFDFADHN